MQVPLRPSPRETTEAMVRNIARELAEIEQAAIRRLDPAQHQGERKEKTVEPIKTPGDAWVGVLSYLWNLSDLPLCEVEVQHATTGLCLCHSAGQDPAGTGVLQTCLPNLPAPE